MARWSVAWACFFAAVAVWPSSAAALALPVGGAPLHHALYPAARTPEPAAPDATASASTPDTATAAAPRSLLVVGAGDLGQRIAAQYHAAGGCEGHGTLGLGEG